MTRVESSLLRDRLTAEKPNQYGGKTTTYSPAKRSILFRGVRRWALKLGSPTKKGVSGSGVVVGVAPKLTHPIEVMICIFVSVWGGMYDPERERWKTSEETKVN